MKRKFRFQSGKFILPARLDAVLHQYKTLYQQPFKRLLRVSERTMKAKVSLILVFVSICTLVTSFPAEYDNEENKQLEEEELDRDIEQRDENEDNTMMDKDLITKRKFFCNWQCTKKTVRTCSPGRCRKCTGFFISPKKCETITCMRCRNVVVKDCPCNPTSG